MFDEAAPDLVAAVADAGGLDVVAGEQQPRVLDRAAGEDVVASRVTVCSGPSSGRTSMPVIVLAGRVGLNPDGVGVEQDRDARMVDQVAGAAGGEALAGLVEAPQVDRELGRVEALFGHADGAHRRRVRS